MFEHRSLRRPSGRTFLLFALAITLFAGCTKDSPAAVAPPEVPAEPTISESFTGSIGQLGDSCHFFTLVENGNMILTLTDLQPLTTLTVGLRLGQPDEARACVAVAQDSSVNIADRLLSTGVAGLEYCACVFDVGNIFADTTVDYVLTVDHT